MKNHSIFIGQAGNTLSISLNVLFFVLPSRKREVISLDDNDENNKEPGRSTRKALYYGKEQYEEEARGGKILDSVSKLIIKKNNINISIPIQCT